MNTPILHTEFYLVTCADIYGFRSIIARIDVVDKAMFPRSGLMGKKGIYEAWNANICPFAIWGLPNATRYYWFKTIEDAKNALNRAFYNQIYHGAVIMSASEYEQEQNNGR